MRISTPIILFVAAASPALSAGMFDETCRHDATLVTATNETPLAVRYKCDRTGGKDPVCAELDLRKCIITVNGMFTAKLLDGFYPEYKGYPGSCPKCHFDKKNSSVICKCQGKRGEEKSTIDLRQWLANLDGTIDGVVNLHDTCRSVEVLC